MHSSSKLFVAFVVSVFVIAPPALGSFPKSPKSPDSPKSTFAGRPSGNPQLDNNETLRRGVYVLDSDPSVIEVGCPSQDTIVVSFATTTVFDSSADLRAKVASWKYVVVNTAKWACGESQPFVLAQVLGHEWKGKTRVHLTVSSSADKGVENAHRVVAKQRSGHPTAVVHETLDRKRAPEWTLDSGNAHLAQMCSPAWYTGFSISSSPTLYRQDGLTMNHVVYSESQDTSHAPLDLGVVVAAAGPGAHSENQ